MDLLTSDRNVFKYKWYKVHPLQKGICAKAGSEGSGYNNRHREIRKNHVKKYR